jgi:hypothetical protein
VIKARIVVAPVLKYFTINNYSSICVFERSGSTSVGFDLGWVRPQLGLTSGGNWFSSGLELMIKKSSFSYATLK